LEPLHPQFDYLKNTVSVVNDYPQAFNNYKITADVYDLWMKKVFSKQSLVNIPEDGVANDVFKIEFPANISNVHFIKLRLFDDKGREAGNSFYWRSNSIYKGRNTLTGPATGGFEDINKLVGTKVQVSYKIRVTAEKHFIDIIIKNIGRSLAFFTQIQWLNKEGKPIRPSFYSNNFMSLLPSESTTVCIETALKNIPGESCFLVVKGFNVQEQRFEIRNLVSQNR
jgi:hypothetical protein